MDVQPTDLQSATTMRLEQGVRDDANEREGNSERERAKSRGSWSSAATSRLYAPAIRLA